MKESTQPTLFVTIPAYNEEETLGEVIASIPREIPGIAAVKVLVYSDGSTDNTALVAQKAQADHVVAAKKNLGLAHSFNQVTRKALELNADIIVNIDADGQYLASEIERLIQPILRGEADIVNGDRQVHTLIHMPVSKKIGNVIGSWTVRQLANITINDASSGFRAYSREAIESFLLMSSHTYTHETLIQASYKNLSIAEVPITFQQRKVGESRLISGIWQHIKKSLATIVRTVLLYKAFKYLVGTGVILFVLGGLGAVRFCVLYWLGDGDGHIQSLVVSSIFISTGFNAILLGAIADFITMNRKMIERQSV